MIEDLKRSRKTLIWLGAIAGIAGIIAASSWFPFVIDTRGWQNEEFLTKELFIIVITIAGLTTTVMMAQEQNRLDEKSNISIAVNRFSKSVNRVKSDVVAFFQWVREVLEPSDEAEEIRAKLASVGLRDESILKFSREELKTLTERMLEKDGRYFDVLTKKQYKAVLEIKDGCCAIKPVDPGYYITSSTVKAHQTVSRRAGKEDSVKAGIFSANVMSRVVQTLIFGMSVASLAYDATQAVDEAQQAMAWITFASRIGTLLMSIFYGWFLGCKMNDIDASYINMRCDVHERFLSDKEFKPKDEQEIAKEKYEAQEGLNEVKPLIEGGTI